MDDDELKSGHKGFMHACKRICQVLEDFSAVFGTVSNVSQGVSMAIAGTNPAILMAHIASTVIGFICNRLFRLLWDTIEFNTIKEDAKTIVSDLRRMANKTEDEKLKKKYNDEADRLEESIKKYSNKRSKKSD